jgi:hypothetical protein
VRKRVNNGLEVVEEAKDVHEKDLLVENERYEGMLM